MHYRGWDEMSFDAHDVNVDYDFCAKSTCNMQLRGKKEEMAQILLCSC